MGVVVSLCTYIVAVVASSGTLTMSVLPVMYIVASNTDGVIALLSTLLASSIATYAVVLRSSDSSTTIDTR